MRAGRASPTDPGMKPRTERLLYYLLWNLDRLSRPTFRNLTNSFEQWAYRNGFLAAIHRLEARGLIERRAGRAPLRYRLSPLGRLAALGGKDPQALWSARWDGLWRVVVFDIPMQDGALRTRLRRHLRSAGFGYLQDSVWISPRPIPENLRSALDQAGYPEAITTLEARTRGTASDQQLVAAAWNFTAIHRRYQACLDLFRELEGIHPGAEDAGVQLLGWAERERRAWNSAAQADPCLPRSLLPDGYLGLKAWKLRCKALQNAGLAAQACPMH